MKIVWTAAAVLLLAGCSGGDAARVQTGTVTRGTVAEVVEAAGTVTPRASAAVVSPADGTVTSVAVEDGQQVAAGQVLLRLSSPSAQAALSRALAANAVAGSTGVAGQALAGVQLQQARAAVDALVVRAPLAGVVTLGAGAAAGGTDLSGLLGSLPSALQGAAGSALGAAPPAASTTTNDVSPGAPVGTGTPLLTVTDLSSLGVAAEVDETDVLQVRTGTAAEVTVDAVPGTTYRATVTSVDLAPTTSTRGGVSYRVRLALTSPTPAPRPGMSAVVDLTVRQARGVLSVPSAAIVRDGADDVVFRVRDGRAVRTVVRTGAEGDDAVEVTEGLREGQRIVTRDADTLSDGDELAL
ncbi:MAG: efflux transporter, family, subunit [Frankiales bacterium]|nr:efflux transporter, family, subunit [Frankiales bacterium]